MGAATTEEGSSLGRLAGSNPGTSPGSNQTPGRSTSHAEPLAANLDTSPPASFSRLILAN